MKKVPIEEIRQKAAIPQKFAVYVDESFREVELTPIYPEPPSCGRYSGIMHTSDADNCDVYRVQFVAHCLNTHQMLLDALKKSENHVNGIASRNPTVDWIQSDYKAIVDAIEAASFVEVEE